MNNMAGIQRFKSMPQVAGEIWQGALVRLPVWIGEEEKAERPWAGLWVCLKSGQINLGEPVMPEEASFDLVLKALVEKGKGQGMQGYRPEKLWVTDPELGQYLQNALAGAEIHVEVVDNDMPIKAVLADMAKSIAGRELPPGALEGAGVDVARMRRFAEAARQFYLIKPWEQLTNEDLIRVESPKVPPELSHFVVMGAGRQTYGLSFFRSRQQFSAFYAAEDSREFYEEQGPVWSVTFGPLQELTIADADLFEDEALPVAGENAYPFASAFDFKRERIGRPDAETLALIEGLLLAMAQTTEDELDSGRWQKEVETAQGKVQFTLSLPDLVEAMQGKKSETPDPMRMLTDRRLMERSMRDVWRLIEREGLTDPDQINAFLAENVIGKEVEKLPAATPQEQAQDLVYEAYEAQGRRRIQLARQALSIWPDCADAYVLLAEQTPDVNKACELYRQAVAAGERALGPERFKEEEGEFWGMLDTRPYMRARLGLAQCLWEAGKKAEAVEHYQALIRLNPGDNQGVRWLLGPALYELGRYDELQKLLDQYGDHGGHDLVLQFLQALLTFRREGDSERARREIALGLKANRYIKKYLIGEAEVPLEEPAMFRPGSEDEAIVFAKYLAPLWQETEGAVKWLKRQKAATGTRKPKGKGRK